MNNIEALKNLGMKEDEAEIYLILLKLGGSKASVVAKEVGLKRTTVYPILQQMTKSGLINIYYKKSQRIYVAEKPARVAAMLQKRLDVFNAIIPVLETIEKKNSVKFGLQFIETLDELKNFYTKILGEYKNQSYNIIGSAVSWEGLDNQWFIQFRKDRAKNNIKTRILLTEESKKINPNEKTLLREYKYLPKNYQFKSTIDIFDDKILIVSPETSSLAVVINIPAMVDVFKNMFEMVWNVQ